MISKDILLITYMSHFISENVRITGNRYCLHEVLCPGFFLTKWSPEIRSGENKWTSGASNEPGWGICVDSFVRDFLLEWLFCYLLYFLN